MKGSRRPLMSVLAACLTTLGCGLDDWRYHPPDALGDVADVLDVGRELGSEASVDVTVDAAMDAAMDVTGDVAADAAIDLLTDTAMDATVDVTRDATADIAMDVSADLAVDVALDRAVDVAPTDVCTSEACAAGAPRLIAPWSASRVTSQRPTLKWRRGASAMTRVEVCRDRLCAGVEHTMDVSTEQTQTPMALTPGVHFWRASALTGTSVSVASATWEFFVGRGSTGDASLGCVPDFNGDGYADVAAGAPRGSSRRGHVYVYPGAMSGPAIAPTLDLSGPMGTRVDGGVDNGAEGQFGSALACAGDVNGDGFADLIAGARNFDDTQGRAYVFLGSAAGLRAEAVIAIPGIDSFDSEFGSVVAGVGDVDGDGYAEVAIGAPNTFAGSRVHVYSGSATGTVTTALVTIFGAATGGPVGASIAGDDFNGDGYADLLLGNGNAEGSAWAWVFPGGSMGLATRFTTLGNGVGVRSLKIVVASAGDVDGDGRADVVLGAAAPESSGVGRAFVHMGGATGVSPAARTTLTAGAAASFTFGVSVAGAGDVNGDGFTDVIVGANEASTRSGRAAVYLGGSSGTATTAVVVLDGGSSAGLFGASVSGAGDVDRDGFDDVVVGAVGRRVARTDGVFLFRGVMTGLRVPGSSLTNPNPSAEDFGVAVAWNGPAGQRLTRPWSVGSTWCRVEVSSVVHTGVPL